MPPEEIFPGHAEVKNFLCLHLSAALKSQKPLLINRRWNMTVVGSNSEGCTAEMSGPRAVA